LVAVAVLTIMTPPRLGSVVGLVEEQLGLVACLEQVLRVKATLVEMVRTLVVVAVEAPAELVATHPTRTTTVVTAEWG
jgi:hypothetical protein